MSETNFIDVLKEYREIIWPKIESYLGKTVRFPDFCQVADDTQHLLDYHYRLVSEYPIRKGKYLRPTLLMLAAQSMGVDPQLAVQTAAAMQVSEDWLLCHDDIEDNSEQRRGLPAIQHLYGTELAINSGDSLHILMWKILTDNFDLIGPRQAKLILNEFFNILNRTAFGQTVEIKWTLENNLNLTDEDVFLIMDGKTSYYTIAGPLRLGAILADASENKLNKLYHFGTLVGRAFQITDDILDLTSDFSGLKKQQGNDIYEGKRSLMLIHLLRNASLVDKEKITGILSQSRSQKTAAEVEFVISCMEKYGSLEYSRQIAKNFALEAKEIFKKDLGFLKNNPYRQQLIDGIDFIVTRDH